MSAPSSVPLGEVATFVRGVTFKPSDVVAVGTPNSVACMRTKNVQEEIDLSDVWAVDEAFVKRSDQFLQKGDVLVSSANSWNLVGKCSWIPELPWRSTFGGFVSVMRPTSPRVDARYLYWWFASGRTQAILRSFGQKTTSISNLNINRCLSLQIPLPQLSEQRRIANLLDGAEQLRAKRRRACSTVALLNRAIFLKAFGDARHERKRWPLVEFGEVVRETKLGMVRAAAEIGPDRPVPYVRMNAITSNGELDLSDVSRIDATAAERAEYRLAEKDFLFNTRNSRELVGKTALFRGPGEFVFNNNVMRIRFGPHVDPEYVAAAFQTEFVQQQLEARKSGTTSVFAVYYKDLRTIPLPLPPLKLQQQFAGSVESVRCWAGAQERSLIRLNELFSSLQSAAFTRSA